MKTTKLLIGVGMVCLLSLLLLFASCKKEEVEAVPEDVAPEFVLLSNGNSVTVNMGKSSLRYFVYEGHVWTKLELPANSGANSFNITVLNFDVQNPPLGGVKTKKYFSNPSFSSRYPDDSVTGGFLVDSGVATWMFNSKLYVCPLDAQKTDFVEITSCDNQAKKVSGNFRFTVKDSGNPNDSLIMSGYFNNQSYVVLN